MSSLASLADSSEALSVLAASPPGCTSSPVTVARSILVFFAINIIGHAVTLTKRPGQRLVWTALSACGMIFCPIVARVSYSTSMMNILFVLRLRWVQHADHRWDKRLMLALFGESMDASDMQSAVDCGALAVEIPQEKAEELGWTDDLDLTGFKALFVDGTPVTDTSVAASGYRYVYVPIGTKTHSERQIVSTDSLMQTLITIGQLVYGAIELYGSWSTSVQRDGLSSPFIVIVPYIIGSFTNLIINMFLFSYSYVVVLPYSEDGQEHRRSAHVCEHPSGPMPPQRRLSLELKVATANPTDEKRLSDASAATVPFRSSESKAAQQVYDPALVQWALDMYELEPVRVQANKQHHLVILLATLATLAIILALTHARVGDRLTAASFMCWIFGGWWYIGCSVAFRTRLQEVGQKHRKLERGAWAAVQLWGPTIIAAVPSVMLSVWGMVTAVQVLIPYYRNCENMQ